MDDLSNMNEKEQRDLLDEAYQHMMTLIPTRTTLAVWDHFWQVYSARNGLGEHFWVGPILPWQEHKCEKVIGDSDLIDKNKTLILNNIEMHIQYVHVHVLTVGSMPFED